MRAQGTALQSFLARFLQLPSSCRILTIGGSDKPLRNTKTGLVIPHVHNKPLERELAFGGAKR